jgi:hypothetical protein
MTEDAKVWFYLFLATAIPGIIWAVSREVHLRTMAKNQETMARNQIRTSRVLSYINKKIDRSDESIRNQFADVKELILDVEERESKRRIEIGLSQTHRHPLVQVDHTDVHGDIHGGQQNIGKTDIGGGQNSGRG